MGDAIQQFVSITGADQDVAERLLEACNGNIELAIEMHLDSGFGQPQIPESQQLDKIEDSSAGPSRPTTLPDIVQNTTGVNSVDNCHSSSDVSSHSQPSIVSDNDVRAPIPQVRGVLVDDPYHAIPFQRARARQPGRSVFDGFRDFQAETRQQEELLDRNAAGAAIATNGNKIKTLQDLFRPPVDISFKGTFEAAKDAGTQQKKWLMANIQNVTEFACQMLNRDVWSNGLVRELIAEHFILWQVYHDSDEGQRFMIYYPVKSFPNISIIDPRTGECVVVWDRFERMDSQLFCELVTQFLSTHSDFVTENEFPPEKKQKTECVIDESEDKQLAAAIAASLEDENLGPKPQISNNSDYDVEPFDYSDDESCTSKLKRNQTNHESVISNAINQCTTQLEANSIEKHGVEFPRQPLVIEEGDDASKIDGPCTKLMLRLPEGNRKQIKMAATALLKELVDYISSIGYSKNKYELVTNFPRRNLMDVDDSRTLQEAGLYPQETIFVQER